MEMISRLIEESVLNIASEYNGDGVKEGLQLMRPQSGDSLYKLQIKFFVLLNEDERMRLHLSNVKSPVMLSLCPHKAERFYDSLCDELIPTWVKNETIPCEAFVDTIRQTYLCS